MRLKLIIDDKRKGRIELPINEKEIRDVYDVGFMIEHDCWETIKLNKFDKSWLSFHRKIEHVIHDVLGEGKTYASYENKKSKNKFVLNKKRTYVIKKPKWKVEDEMAKKTGHT